MSKTTRMHNGQEYTPKSREQRKIIQKKFFGFTSGSHSTGIHTHEWVDGKVVYTKSDRAPIKNKDFVKYGWPFETRHKSVIKNKNIEDALDEEVNNYKWAI